MPGIRWEPVEVWLGYDKPARFVWRGRLFTVLFVHDRQVTAAPDPPLGDDASTCDASTDDASTGAPVGYVMWRVEATDGKGVPGVIFELLQEPTSQRWLLARG